MDIGERLKLVRNKYGLSQRELAKRAGVTNSTISMIEKNSVSPSISSLRKVISGIPMTLVEFFADEEPQIKNVPVHYRREDLLDISVKNVQYKLVGKAFGKRDMAFMEEIYEPGADTGTDLLVHEGQEAGMIISGKLEITIDNKTHTLVAGEGYYFDCTSPHRFHNPFDEPCRLISSVTPASF